MNCPSDLIEIFSHFFILFSIPTWNNGLKLIIGALLCPRQRTVAAALRMIGHSQDDGYQRFHRVLNRAKWSAFSAGKILLGLLINTSLSVIPGILVIALDETVERRQGKKIKAKGCYRDAVRSSESCVIKCFGLKWISASVILRMPWCIRPWAIPYLTILAHSKEANQVKGHKHRTIVDIAGQMVLVTMRWLRYLNWSAAVIFLGDGGYASVKFMWQCLRVNATLVCRFRLDAALYDPPSPRQRGKRGRPSKKGKKQKSLKVMASDPKTKWTTQEVTWYKGVRKKIEYFTGISLWHTSGYNPVPIRWVVVRIPETGRVEAICSTDQSLSAVAIVELFVLRWNIEVLFEEVRRHLGVETQRQWSDLAIERTTPCLFGLFSIVILYGLELWKATKIKPQTTAWYRKSEVTFSDVLAAVRYEILSEMNYKDQDKTQDSSKFSFRILDSLIRELASVA